MALQGTIDSFDLTEVIRMLAGGEKTGRLSLSGDRGSGSLWFADGQVVAGATDATDLVSDHPAVLFQLLRFQEGSFLFDQGDEATDPGVAVEADALIEEAERRLAEWTQIEAVVPSLRHEVSLRVELSRSDVVIDQACWRAIAAIAGGKTVGELGQSLEQDELDVSRTVKTLVELSLVEVGDEPQGPSSAPAPAEFVDPDFLQPTDTVSGDPAVTETIVTDVVGPAANGDSGFDADPLTETVDPAPVDGSARNQLDALASGFGLTDEPFGTESAPVPPPPPTEPLIEVDEPVEFGEPAPLAGAADNGAGSFPIEEAEAAGEARTPLFAHDSGAQAGTATEAVTVPQPGEAAEVARQLANLSPEAARAVAAAARATTEEEREAALALVSEDGDEPLDPDLLRSFLTSVRQ